MSEQDELSIIGKLVRDSSEIKKRLAFVQQELELAHKDLKAFEESLIPRVRTGRTLYAKPNIGEYITKYMDLSKLLSLIEEQDQLDHKAEEVRHKLTELGV